MTKGERKAARAAVVAMFPHDWDSAAQLVYPHQSLEDAFLAALDVYRATFGGEPLDVYGTAEAMALLGVQKSQFHVLARTANFPKPARIRWPGWETDARLAATPLYDGPEMREYAATRKGT